MTRIACVQLSLVADEASNLKKCLSLIDQAATEKPELIVLPEMSNWSGGLVRTRAEALEHGTPVPGRFLDALAERAERHRCFVAAGVIERLGDESYPGPAQSAIRGARRQPRCDARQDHWSTRMRSDGKCSIRRIRHPG